MSVPTSKQRKERTLAIAADELGCSKDKNNWKEREVYASRGKSEVGAWEGKELQFLGHQAL